MFGQVRGNHGKKEDKERLKYDGMSKKRSAVIINHKKEI